MRDLVSNVFFVLTQKTFDAIRFTHEENQIPAAHTETSLKGHRDAQQLRPHHGHRPQIGRVVLAGLQT